MKLRIWWIPQIPLREGKEPFCVYVKSPEEAKWLLDILALYDQYQYASNIKPDYSNAGGLEIFEDGEWVTWYDEDGNDLDEHFDFIAELEKEQ